MLNIRQRLEIDSECVFFGASITAAGVPGARSAELSRPSADGQEALKLKTRLITLPRANVSCDWSFSLNGSHCQRELPKRFIHPLSPLRKKLALLAHIRPDSSCLFRSFRVRPLRPQFTFITHARIHSRTCKHPYRHGTQWIYMCAGAQASFPTSCWRCAVCALLGWAFSSNERQSTDPRPELPASTASWRTGRVSPHPHPALGALLPAPAGTLGRAPGHTRTAPWLSSARTVRSGLWARAAAGPCSAQCRAVCPP